MMSSEQSSMPWLENAGIQALLKEAKVSHITDRGSLTVEEIDRYFQSVPAVRCITISYFDSEPKWIVPPKQRENWEKEIKPRMGMAWDGYYEAREWRTEQQELIILFIFGYVPI